MKDFMLHALDIGALALWLSVTGFAAVAIWVPAIVAEISTSEGGLTSEIGEFFSLGTVSSDDAPGESVAPEPAYQAGEPLPAPPRAPAKTVSAPLPKAPSSPARAAAGMSTAARIAAGHTPGPSYPSESRRAGQTGTVVVQFTVDASGRVADAVIYSSSTWELLDREALRTVKSWRYPAGDVMTLIRPIVFQLP